MLETPREIGTIEVAIPVGQIEIVQSGSNVERVNQDEKGLIEDTMP